MDTFRKFSMARNISKYLADSLSRLNLSYWLGFLRIAPKSIKKYSSLNIVYKVVIVV